MIQRQKNRNGLTPNWTYYSVIPQYKESRVTGQSYSSNNVLILVKIPPCVWVPCSIPPLCKGRQGRVKEGTPLGTTHVLPGTHPISCRTQTLLALRLRAGLVGFLRSIRRCLQRERGTRLFFSACPHKGPDVGDHAVDIFVAQLLTERRHRLLPFLHDFSQVRISELRHLFLISVVCGLF